MSYSSIPNLTGHPTVVVPTGFDAEGGPTGITFKGRLFGEAGTLLVARTYQEQNDFHHRRPPQCAVE